MTEVAYSPPCVADPLMQRLALLRILIASYATVWVAVRTPHLLDMVDFADRRFDPVGPVGVLSDPLAGWIVVLGVVLTPLLGLAMALGWRYRITAPLFAIFFTVVTTYRNSWGQIFHTENLAAIHLVILAFSPADRWWSLRRPGAGSDDGDDGGWAVRALAVATVCTYLVAGLSKLRVGGWAWVDGDVLLHQVAFDNARKDLLGDTSSPFARLLVDYAWLTGPAAVTSMVVELGAPFALLGRRLAFWWSALAWAFHVGVLVFMAILFPYHLLGLAMAPLLPLENWWASLDRRRRRW